MSTSVNFSTASTAGVLNAKQRSFGTWDNAFNTQLNRINTLSDSERAQLLQKQEELAAREEQAKTELLALGLEEDTNPANALAPKGFPLGVTWADARDMVTRKKVVGSEIHPDKLRRAISDQSTLSLALRYNARPDPKATPEQQAAYAAAQSKAKAELLEAGIGEAVLAMLTELGIETETETGLTPAGVPEGFDENVDWVYLKQRVAVPLLDGLELDEEALAKTYAATERMAASGITSIYPDWPPGTTVLQAFEDSLKQNKKGILSSIFDENNITLKDFPSRVTRYEAYKMVEDPAVAGGVDATKVAALRADYAELKKIGIFDIGKFKSLGGTTPSKVKEIIDARPEKFRPTQAELEVSKPNWKIPEPLIINGPVSGAAWEALTVAHAKLFNPEYTEDEIMARYGFNTIRVLAQGEKL
ncbi:MAG: hypothetical protein FJY38_07420 [Betaproteobacteria bacterium]|nr:hypothetical protein [Betaproteobacteria bacterium]